MKRPIIQLLVVLLGLVFFWAASTQSSNPVLAGTLVQPSRPVQPAQPTEPNKPALPASTTTKPSTRPALLAATKPAMPTSLPSAGKILSDDEYKTLFASELGSLWKPELFSSLKTAHQNLEQYFATPSKRKEALANLEKLKLDPNIVGRLTRIRDKWPELKPGIYFHIEKPGPTPVQYFLGIPKNYNRAKSIPLVVWLCDYTPFIDENGDTLKLRPDQVAELYARWIDAEMRQHPDAAVLMPIINTNVLWGPGYEGVNRAFLPVLHVQDRVNIDPAQVYLVGHSMPGEAIWNLALMHPTYFSGLMPLAGGVISPFQTLRIRNLRNAAVYTWQDEDDKVIDISVPTKLVSNLKSFNGTVEFKKTKKIGHFPTPEICEELYKKMRAFKRNLYPLNVSLASNRPEIKFNRNDWIQVLQYLSDKDQPEKDQRILTSSHTTILVTNKSCNVDAKIDKAKNQIAITAKEVQSARIYLNDQMVDMTKNVVITWNGLKQYDAVPKPSLSMMLEDQLLLGRGWRYFTHYAEIDFDAINEARELEEAKRAATRPSTGRP